MLVAKYDFFVETPNGCDCTLETTFSLFAHATADRSENNYPLPEDQREQDRLDLQHELFLKSFSGKLALAPIGNNLRNVLDLGTGKMPDTSTFPEVRDLC